MNHLELKSINALLEYKDDGIFLGDVQIPSNVLNASYRLRGDSSLLKAYVNGFVTLAKSGDPRASSLDREFPFLDDGTLFTEISITHAELKLGYWPSMTSGVEKTIIDLQRKSGKPNFVLYMVGVFGSHWNPNQQIELLKMLGELDGCTDITKTDDIKNSKDHIDMRFSLSDFYNFRRIVREDGMWWDHIVSMCDSIYEILKYQPDYVIPYSYKFNKLQTTLNRIEATVKGVIYRFDAYYQKYCFFDGLQLDGYTVRIPADSMALIEAGSDLNICIGQDRFSKAIMKGETFIMLLFKDDQPAIAAEYDGQIMMANNTPVGGALRDRIVELMSGINKADRVILSKYVSHEYIAMKLEQLKEKVGNKHFRELEKMYKSDSKQSTLL